MSLNFSCKTTQNKNLEIEKIVFTLKKTTCRGRCPVYKMDIFSSGKVLFEGKKYVEKTGKFEKKILKKEVEILEKKFLNANFFDFKDEYTSGKTDLPNTYISFNYKEKSKRIRDYDNAPKELKNLEKLLEEIANSKDWKKVQE